MNITVRKVNAFTQSRTGGNPAGVVLNTPDLTEVQMKQISKKLVVSETAFVFPSTVADVKVRFFSPAVEVDLCGHATIATFYTMALQGLFSKKNNVVTQETNIGILPVHLFFSDDNIIERVMMTQSKPIYKNIHLNISMIAAALAIEKKEIDESFPQQIVSTGLFTLPLCIKSFDVLKTMNPNFKKIKKICEQIGAGSFHVFTFETLEPYSTYHARNFAPVYGINEDPVTGTANGAVSSYLKKHHLIKDKKILCEQGDIIGRPGRVVVEIEKDTVQVGGYATIAEERTMMV
jgi:PhzF family phenazine biosynthesis protein